MTNTKNNNQSSKKRLHILETIRDSNNNNNKNNDNSDNNDNNDAGAVGIAVMETNDGSGSSLSSCLSRSGHIQRHIKVRLNYHKDEHSIPSMIPKNLDRNYRAQMHGPHGIAPKSQSLYYNSNENNGNDCHDHRLYPMCVNNNGNWNGKNNKQNDNNNLSKDKGDIDNENENEEKSEILKEKTLTIGNIAPIMTSMATMATMATTKVKNDSNDDSDNDNDNDNYVTPFGTAQERTNDIRQFFSQSSLSNCKNNIINTNRNSNVENANSKDNYSSNDGLISNARVNDVNETANNTNTFTNNIVNSHESPVLSPYSNNPYQHHHYHHHHYHQQQQQHHNHVNLQQHQNQLQLQYYGYPQSFHPHGYQRHYPLQQQQQQQHYYQPQTHTTNGQQAGFQTGAAYLHSSLNNMNNGTDSLDRQESIASTSNVSIISCEQETQDGFAIPRR